MHSSHAICFDLLFFLCKRRKSLQELDSINIQVLTNYQVGWTSVSASNFCHRSSGKIQPLILWIYILFSFYIICGILLVNSVQWKKTTIDLLIKCYSLFSVDRSFSKNTGTLVFGLKCNNTTFTVNHITLSWLNITRATDTHDEYLPFIWKFFLAYFEKYLRQPTIEMYKIMKTKKQWKGGIKNLTQRVEI